MSINPRYKVPSREAWQKWVGDLTVATKEKIKKMIVSSGRVAICTDIWTQKNMVASFLAVTGTLVLLRFTTTCECVLAYKKVVGRPAHCRGH